MFPLLPEGGIDYSKLTPDQMQMFMNQLGSLLTLSSKGVVSGTPTALYAHGTGGLFSTPGLNRGVFSALALPRKGLQSILPIYGTLEMNQVQALITQVDETTGSEPVNPCDDPPVVGFLRNFTRNLPFGRFSRQTKVYDITRVGKRTRRSEFTDLQLVGNPAQDLNAQGPTPTGAPQIRRAINSEVAKALFEFGVGWSKDFSKKIYNGNPANNTAGSGYMEFKGLDLQYNTGALDFIDGATAASAVDSVLWDANNINVSDNPGLFVKRIIGMVTLIWDTAAQLGLDPVELVISMRPALFRELTEWWPMAYSSYRTVQTAGTTVLNLDASSMENMRARMRGDMQSRTGQGLLIDNVMVPVALDDSVPETFAAGEYTTSVYINPMQIVGGVETMYMDFFDYSAAGTIDFARYFSGEGVYDISDGGRFLWHKKPANNWCTQWMAITEPRVVCEVPHLAGRIYNLKYSPMLHERSPFSGEQDYKGGGVNTR